MNLHLKRGEEEVGRKIIKSLRRFRRFPTRIIQSIIFTVFLVHTFITRCRDEDRVYSRD